MIRDRPEGDPLARARQEIEGIDRSIVLLLAARLDAAERAIRLRTASGGGVSDREQERQVLQRSQGWAGELGVPRALIDALFRSLMEEGKARVRCTETSSDPPVVTVFVAGPPRPGLRLRGGSDLEVIAVPTSR